MNQRDFDEENQEAIKENLKADLINDLISVSTVMEELWKYHPENPAKIDIVSEYLYAVDVYPYTLNLYIELFVVYVKVPEPSVIPSVESYTILLLKSNTLTQYPLYDESTFQDIVVIF